VQLTGDAPLNIARTRDCRETLLSILEVICQDCASASLIVIELLRTQLQYDVVLACNAAAPAYLVQEDDASPVIHDDASLRHKPSHGFVGLVNMGNTCYMNSILQQLNALAPFREAMLDDASDVNGNLAAAYQHKVLTEMKSTFRALNALLLNAHDPRSLIKAFSDVLPIQNVYQQQDADEFLGALLDHIEEAMKYVPSCILDE
jgi:ubiquitin C-terminal hydrolase